TPPSATTPVEAAAASPANDGGVNPVAMQALAPSTPPQSLAEIAGAAPPAPNPNSVRQPAQAPVVPEEVVNG
ncbi:MAG: hypothetical protein N2383_16270, partial [Caldilineales bacterium]|nr:hypothetical protein [Caldilineales bacterium]